MNQESEDNRRLDLKLTLLMILVNFHYSIVAYNHTSPTFINYTPPFFCEVSMSVFKNKNYLLID